MPWFSTDIRGELAELVLERCERLEAKYKGVLPFRRVHAPEVVEADGAE